MNRNDTREYVLVRCEDTTDGDWEECSCCGYPAPLHDYNSDRVGGDEPERLCRLCANVVKSNNPEVRRLQQTVLNVGNAILAALSAATDDDAPQAQGKG